MPHCPARYRLGVVPLTLLGLLALPADAQPSRRDALRRVVPRAGSVEARRLASWQSLRFTYVGDDQRLAVMDPRTKALRYGPFAEIRPRDDLGRLRIADYAARREGDTLGVVTSVIHYDVTRGPDEGVYEKLQLRPGRNALYLRYDGKVGDPAQESSAKYWRAFVVWEGNPADVRPLRFQSRESHAADPTPPPATARFEWRPDDEWVWVSCAVGCCHVGGPGF